MIHCFRPLALSALVACAPLGLTADEAAAASPEAAPQVSAMSDAELFGFVFAVNSDLQALGFNAEESDAFARGVRAALAGVDYSPEELASRMPALQAFVQGKVMAEEARVAEANGAATAAYFASLRESGEVQFTESGLGYEILRQGEGAVPGPDSRVRVDYEGRLIDGTVFDSSYDRGRPAEFSVGGVIPGFAEGLALVAEGGKVRLHIPGELGYNQSPPPGSAITPGATLIFEVEMLEVLDAPTGEE